MRRPRWSPVLLLALTALSGSSLWGLRAYAQAAPAAAEAKARPTLAPVRAPDVVKLVNGGLVRGTISELMPGQYVVIMNLSGEPKRFAAREFSYAGPEQPASAAAAPAGPADADAPSPGALTYAPKARGRARGLQFQQADPNTAEPLTLYVRDFPGAAPPGSWVPSDGYRSLCTAPCVPALKPGDYQLGIGMGTGRPRAVREVVNISGDERLVGNYRSRIGVRTAGWLITLAASVASIVMSASGDSDLLAPAIGTLVVGAAIGLPLCFVRPKVSLSKFVPLQR